MGADVRTARGNQKLFVCLAAVALGACGSADDATDLTPPAAGTGGAVEAAPEQVPAAPAAPATVGLEPRNPVIEQQLAYGESADRNLIGYLAMPADAVEPQPGLLVVHESAGLDEDIRVLTRRLAGEGFVVLAADLFGGEVAETPEAVQRLAARVTQSPEATLGNLRQGYEYLSRYALAPKVGALGWSLGGTWALQSALSHAGELDAVVVYYGQVVRDRDQLGALSAPLLGLFGAEDPSIPLADIQAFRGTLNDLGKDAEVRIYSRVGHAFASPGASGYDPESAEDAWERTVAFLNRTLR